MTGRMDSATTTITLTPLQSEIVLDGLRLVRAAALGHVEFRPTIIEPTRALIAVAPWSSDGEPEGLFAIPGVPDPATTPAEGSVQDTEIRIEAVDMITKVLKAAAQGNVPGMGHHRRYDISRTRTHLIRQARLDGGEDPES